MTLSIGQGYTSQVCAGDLAWIPFSFPVFPNADGSIDLKVEIRDAATGALITTAIWPTDYHYVLAAAPSVGGRIEPQSASLFAAGRKAWVLRTTKAHQEARLPELQKLPAKALEDMGDRLTAMIQDAIREAGLAVKVSRGMSPAELDQRFFGHVIGLSDAGVLEPRSLLTGVLNVHASWQSWLTQRMPSRLDGGGLVDVRDCYASDATTDTQALQAAIDSLPAAGGSVLISRDLTITRVNVPKSIRLFSWNQSKITQAAATANDMIVVTGSDLVLHLHDLVLDQQNWNQAARSGTALIRAGDSPDISDCRLICERVKFFNPCESAVAWYGDYIDSSIEQVIIRDCVFRGGSEGSSSPVFKPSYILLADAPYATICDNLFDLGKVPETLGGRGGIWNLRTQTGAQHAVLTITGNRFRNVGCMAAGAPGAVDIYMHSKSSRILFNSMQDSHGAGFNIKNQSRHAIVMGNSVEGISAGSIPFLLLPANIGDADAQFIIAYNQARGASGVASMNINGMAVTLGYSFGIQVVGNQLWGHDATGLVVDNVESVQILNNEIRGGTIPITILNALGQNTVAGNRCLGGSGLYQVYIDQCPSGDFLLSGNLLQNGGTSSSMYVRARDVTIAAHQGRGGVSAMEFGACASINIAGGSHTGLGSGKIGISISGAISGDVNISGFGTDAQTPLIQAGVVSGKSSNKANSWNTATSAPSWSAPIGTVVDHVDAAAGEAMGWQRVSGAWKDLALVDLGPASADEVRQQSVSLKYLTPQSLSQRAGVIAHKNGTAQTNIANTGVTLLTFGTEALDRSGEYDPATSTFTAARSRLLRFRVRGLLTAGHTATDRFILYLKQGSSEVRRSVNYGPTNDCPIQLDVLVNVVAGQPYTIEASCTTAAGNITLSGSDLLTSLEITEA